MAQIELLKADDVPEEHREPWILSGYRQCPSSLRSCLLSLFTTCNETANFWTHFLPGVFFLYKTMAALRTSEEPGQLAYVCFLSSLAVFLLTSSFAHALWPIGKQTRDACFFLDYAAMNLYMFGSAAGIYVFFFSPNFYMTTIGKVYVTLAGFLCPASTLVSCLSRFAKGHNLRKITKLGAFAMLYSWTTLPLLYDLTMHGRFSELANEVMHIFILCLGVGIYALHWPECWFPGLFDFLGHSHNWLHCLGALAVHCQYLGLSARKQAHGPSLPGGPERVTAYCNGLLRVFTGVLIANVGIICGCVMLKSRLSHAKLAMNSAERERSFSRRSGRGKVSYCQMNDDFATVAFIFECGTKLDMDMTTICLAASYFHRFSAVAEMSEYDQYMIAATCLYLAAKMEEKAVAARDLINVVQNTLHPDKEVLPLDEVFSACEKSLAHLELHICRMLKFEMVVDTPHKFLLHYLHDMDNWIGSQLWNDLPIPEMCWTLLQDFFFSSNVLKYSPQHVAIAIIYFSLQVYGRELPEDHGSQWMKVLCPTVELEKVWTIIDDLQSVFEKEAALFPSIAD
ncbi:unnamed protein product [Notodromas monacha]|uniref:Cyclin-Q n=1 Tax=Notodromas monacha TaxID=399045 RepID=A0A7R9GDI9_9CRUS|nr:unnamed protein product [Notodromas monacha]CAG0918594.1 unnamed protein product [Notodromas monacha]